MTGVKRLTAERCSGIKTGYWSQAKKEELVQRLGQFEDLGLEPEEIKERLKQKKGADHHGEKDLSPEL